VDPKGLTNAYDHTRAHSVTFSLHGSRPLLRPRGIWVHHNVRYLVKAADAAFSLSFLLYSVKLYGLLHGNNIYDRYPFGVLKSLCIFNLHSLGGYRIDSV
jgi:hypothetical protein